jgi:hypothetical protein
MVGDVEHAYEPWSGRLLQRQTAPVGVGQKLEADAGQDQTGDRKTNEAVVDVNNKPNRRNKATV